MRINRKIITAIAALIVSVICLLTLSSCLSNGKIKDWDNDLIIMLSRRYMLSIESDFIFVDGYYEKAFQDNSIHLSFKVPNASIGNFYNVKHYIESIYSDEDYANYKECLAFDGELYTFLFFYDSDDAEYTLVRFMGRYPFKRA